MASKTYSGDYSNINIDTEWGGDKSTGYLPLNGAYVERFIKDSIKSKIGCIKEIGDRVCAFASESDYADYVYYIEQGETEKANALIINDWQGITPNNILLNMVNPTGNTQSYLDGTDEMPIKFSFDTVDQNYNHTVDERGTVVVTVNKGATTVGSVTKVIEQNTEVSIDLKDYLQTGNNEVILKVTGNNSLATISKTFTFAVIKLTFEDVFDISSQYNPNEHSTISVPFYVTAPSTTVTVEFVIDGDTDNKSTMSLNSPAGNLQTKELSIEGLSEGTHSLQMCATCLVGSDIFATDIHYREFAIVTSTKSIPYTMIANTIPVELGGMINYIKPEDDIVIYGARQYAAMTLTYAVYQYNVDTTKVAIYLDDEIQGSIQSIKNNTVMTYKIYPEESGNKVIRIDTYNEDGITIASSRYIYVDIEDAQLNVEEKTTNIVLQLKARGRTNSDDDRAEWNDTKHGINGTLKNFTWTDTSGWDSTSNTLIIGNGNEVEIDYQPFGDRSSIISNGLTYILEFSTENVSNDDAVICDMTVNGIGLNITASKVSYDFVSGTSAVSVRFKSGELYRVALVIKAPVAGESQNPLMMLYVNGVISAVYAYNPESIHSQAKNIVFKGGEDAEIRIKEIKIYSTAFVSDEVVNDYILSRDTLYDTRDTYGNLSDRGLLSLYNANNIYEDGSVYPDLDTVSYDTTAIGNNIPIVFLTGRGDKESDADLYHAGDVTYKSIHDLEGNNTSKDPYIFVDVYYVNTQHPELNFYARRARLKIQGTSSVNYQKKNYKLSTNRKKYRTEVWCGEECLTYRDMYDAGHTEDIYQPKDKGKIPFKKVWEEGDSETDPGVAIKGEKAPQPVHTFVLKADCSDSSSAHNTGVARYWNQLFKSFTINGEKVGMTRAQEWAEANDYAYDVRTCVDGYPTVLFYREDETSAYEFIGKYNFNNDKGDTDVYGMEGGIDDAFENEEVFDPRRQTWELLSSSDEYALGIGDMSKFKDYTSDATGAVNYQWMGGFEARYPEQPDNVISGGTTNLITQFVNEGHVDQLQEFYTWLSSTRYDDDATSVHYGTSTQITIAGHKYADKTVTINGVKYKNGKWSNTADARKAKFQIEKWDHFEIYKMAAYYCYLIRFGAVDQVVKNAIFATEGNEWDTNGSTNYPCQWYYDNYDNDTILGSRNDGRLAYGPYIERKSASAEEETSGETQTYAYAGDLSVIWNQLTDDEEFMGIVQTVDNALVSAGLTYGQAIYYFNTLQSEKWCERIYNRDQIYKYISPYYASKNATSVDFPLLQGARMSHRKWWISKRFALYDSLYASGDYGNNTIDFKCADALKNDVNSVTKEMLVPTLTVGVTPGANVYYGYMVKQAGTAGATSTVATWTGIKGFDTDGNVIPFSAALDTTKYITIGNYVSIMAAESIAELDLSLAIHRMTTLKLSNVYHSTRGTQLKVLKIGNTDNALALKNSENIALNAQYEAYISRDSGLTKDSINVTAAVMLEYLDIYGLTYVTDIDLSTLKYLKTFRGFASGLNSLSFANGCPLSKLEVPKDLTSLNLTGLNNLSSKNITFESASTKIDALTVVKCDKLNTDHQFVFDWYANKTVDDSDCRLTLEGINWTLSSYTQVDQFIDLLNIGDLSLKGEVAISSIDSKRYYAIKDYFDAKGMEVFDFSKNSEFRIRLTAVNLFLRTADVVYEGNELTIEPNILANCKVDISNMTYLISEYYDGDPEHGGIAIKDRDWNDSIETVENESGETINGLFKPTEVGKARYVQVLCSANALREDSGITGTISTYININVAPRTYVSGVTIEPLIKEGQGGNGTALTQSDGYEYLYQCNVSPIITGANKGNYEYSWKVIDTEDTVDKFTSHVQITGDNNASICKLVRDNTAAVLRGALQITITNVSTYEPYTPSPSSVTATIGLIIKDSQSILSKYENPEVFYILSGLGLTDETSMTKEQAATVTNEQIKDAFVDHDEITEFTQFAYFTSLTAITDNMFSGCTGLSSFTFVNEDCPTSHIGSIGNNAFEGCAITAITIPSSVNTIGDGAFAYCKNLAKITYSISTLSQKPNVSAIGTSAFSHCYALEMLEIPAMVDVSHFGTYVFEYCTGATEFLINNANTTSIREGTFYHCESLSEIEIPEGVSELYGNCFGYCTRVQSITIADSVSTIYENAFQYCGSKNTDLYSDGSVNSVIIGTGLTDCNYYAFRDVHPVDVYLKDGYSNSTPYLFNTTYSPYTFLMQTIHFYKDIALTPSAFAEDRDAYFIVNDNDVDASYVAESGFTEKVYYSCDGSLYYYQDGAIEGGENKVLLVRYQPGTGDTQNYIYDKTDVYAQYYFCGYFYFENLTIPSNIILPEDGCGMTHCSGDTLTIKPSVDKCNRFLSSCHYNHYVLTTATTYLPDDFTIDNFELPESVTGMGRVSIATAMYIFQRNEITSDNISKIAFLGNYDINTWGYPSSTDDKNTYNLFDASPLSIYVLPEDYDYYVDIFSNCNIKYASLIKSYYLPTSGFINIISGNTWSNNAVVTLDGGNIIAKQLYDGSYYYECESGITDTVYNISIDGISLSGYMPGNGKVEIVLDEINTTGIDFGLYRGESAMTVNGQTGDYTITTNSGSGDRLYPLGGWYYDSAVNGFRVRYGVNECHGFTGILSMKFPSLNFDSNTSVTITVNYKIYMRQGSADLGYFDTYCISTGDQWVSGNTANSSLRNDNASYDFIITSNTQQLTFKVTTDQYLTQGRASVYGLIVNSIQFDGQTVEFTYPDIETSFVDENDFVSDVENAVIVENDKTSCYKMQLPEYTASTTDVDVTKIPTIDAIQTAFEFSEHTWMPEDYLVQAVDSEDTDGFAGLNVNGEYNAEATSGYVLDTTKLEYNNRLTH